eukprot:INCI7056.1.p1 GENE.INCI7056.1~~INCI7056.1.p1  ORF type:complete len:440 (+),score=102.09 INCI7056.1:690-2009(+)
MPTVVTRSSRESKIVTAAAQRESKVVAARSIAESKTSGSGSPGTNRLAGRIGAVKSAETVESKTNAATKRKATPERSSRVPEQSASVATAAQSKPPTAESNGADREAATAATLARAKLNKAAAVQERAMAAASIASAAMGASQRLKTRGRFKRAAKATQALAKFKSRGATSPPSNADGLSPPGGAGHFAAGDSDVGGVAVENSATRGPAAEHSATEDSAAGDSVAGDSAAGDSAARESAAGDSAPGEFAAMGKGSELSIDDEVIFQGDDVTAVTTSAMPGSATDSDKVMPLGSNGPEQVLPERRVVHENNGSVTANAIHAESHSPTFADEVADGVDTQHTQNSVTPSNSLAAKKLEALEEARRVERAEKHRKAAKAALKAKEQLELERRLTRRAERAILKRKQEEEIQRRRTQQAAKLKERSKAKKKGGFFFKLELLSP